MKKYFSGVIGIVFALTLIAFQGMSNSATTDDEEYFWYTVTYDEDNPTGAILSPSDIRFSGLAQTETYADLNDGCSGTTQHCLRGFTSQLTTNPAMYPISAVGQKQTLKTP